MRGAGGLHDSSGRFRIDRSPPVAVLLRRTAHDHRIGVVQKARNGLVVDPRSDENRKRAAVGGDLQIIGSDRFSGGRPGHDGTIRAHEFECFHVLIECDVRGDRMGTVFLAGICEYRDAFRSDVLPVSQQGTGIRGLEKSFVRDAGKCEPLCSNELAVSRQRGRECGPVGTRQNLDAERSVGQLSQGGGDHSHRRDDLGSDVSLEVGEIVHVLDDQGVESGLDENLGILGDTGDDLIEIRCRPRCPGQRWNMNHPDQGTVSAENVSGSFFRDASV